MREQSQCHHHIRRCVHGREGTPYSLSLSPSLSLCIFPSGHVSTFSLLLFLFLSLCIFPSGGVSTGKKVHLIFSLSFLLSLSLNFPIRRYVHGREGSPYFLSLLLSLSLTLYFPSGRVSMGEKVHLIFSLSLFLSVTLYFPIRPFVHV